MRRNNLTGWSNTSIVGQGVTLRPKPSGYYQLGFSSIILLIALLPSVYAGLSYSVNLSYALAGISLGGFIIASFVGTEFISRRLALNVRPPITAGWKQTIVAGVTLLVMTLTYRIVTAFQLTLPFLASAGSVNDLIILGGSAIGEEGFFRGFLLTGLYIALLLLTNNKPFSGGTAVVISGVSWTIFHEYTYGQSPSILTFILITGVVLGIAFVATGNLLVTMFPHFFWNVGPLLFTLLGVCIPGVTC